MCGIAAILFQDLNQREAFVSRSLTLLHHRGPDGQGKWQGEGVGLAHTRLAILDLSAAGAQPMWSESGRYVITYNGEIYNHLELRQKYFPGKQWRGHADTETLLALFEKLGMAMFAELVGMWALAIWDTVEKRLLLSRDRYGQKPLYYRFYPDGSFAAASEIKPLLIPGQSNPANPLMVAEYLALGNYGHLGAQTFFKEVEQLLPGHYAWVTGEAHTLSPLAYWRLPSVPRRDKIPVGEREITQLKALLWEAVQSQTLSDVPIGGTLSGGLDSSVVTGMLAAGRDESHPLAVFTAQTPGSRWDESPYVRAVQEKWGGCVQIHAKDLNQVRISSFLEKSLLVQEEPYGDPSIMAHGFLMDMAKAAGIKVILGGQGADEIFRGYPHSVQQLFAHEMSNHHWRYVFKEVSALNLGFSGALRLGIGAFLPEVERSLRYRSREKRRQFLGESVKEAARQGFKNDYLPLANDWEEALSESIHGVHIPHLVHYDDRNGMSRSIEGRMPFLDHRLLELLSSFAPSSYFKNGLSKNLLRQAGKDVIPYNVFNRKDKIGFYTPLADMLKQDADWIIKVDCSEDWVDRRAWNSLKQLLRNASLTPENTLRIWRIVCFYYWMVKYEVKL